MVDIDIEKFFDEVNHNKLMSEIAKRVKNKRLLKLLRQFQTIGILSNGLVRPSDPEALKRQDKTSYISPLNI